MATAQTQTISLKTADGSVFQVDEPVAMEFAIVKTFFDENSDTRDSAAAIPLPNVTAKPLVLIIEYCKGNLAAGTSEDAARAFGDSFLKDKNNEELKEMILAANYLNVAHLLELLNTTIAKRIQNRSVEYVRKFFGIENDYTPQEEENLRQENAWAFDGVDPDDD